MKVKEASWVALTGEGGGRVKAGVFYKAAASRERMQGASRKTVNPPFGRASAFFAGRFA